MNGCVRFRTKKKCTAAVFFIFALPERYFPLPVKHRYLVEFYIKALQKNMLFFQSPDF